MEIQMYLDILKRRWLTVLVVALAVFLITVLASAYISPKYQAETRLRIVTPLGGTSGETNYQTTFANRLMNTYAQIATSQQVRNELKKKLGLNALPEISVNIIPDSEIIQVVVVSENPAISAKTANTLVDVLLSYQDQAISNRDSEELNVLAERSKNLQDSLAEYQEQHDELAQAYAKTTADMDVLDKAIRLRESSYQNLSDQYNQILVDEAVFASAANKITKDALTKEMERIGSELDSLNEQYKNLSMKSNEYLQQITLLRLTIQNNQSAYSNLISRYDSVLMANSRQENAQNIVTVSAATEPTQSSSPSRGFILGLGALCGLVIGVIAAFAVDALDPRVYSMEQISRLRSEPILGGISKYPRGNKTPSGQPDIQVERDYWMLRTRLQALLKGGPYKSVLLTSPTCGEGKSTITHKLALGFAQNSHKVLVIDADMHTGVQHKLFEVSSDLGLGDFLDGHQNRLDDLILKNVRANIDLLPSPRVCDNPIDLLQSPHLHTLLASIQEYDVILFDTPALLAVPDALALSKLVDGVLLIAQSGHTTSTDIEATCQQLSNIDSRILGLVVNQISIKRGENPYSPKTGQPRKAREAAASSV